MNWVLDLVLKACFDRIEHSALMAVIQKRIADKTLHTILSFEHKANADNLRAALEENLQRYGLELNQAKTRLLCFGRNAQRNSGQKSETFGFLGLTHMAGKDRRGRYLVKRKTARKRMQRSLRQIRDWRRKHRHEPLAWQW